MRDEGRSLGAGLQERASNHLKLRWLRARVVSVKDKSRHKIAQVWIRETSASEPLMRCRNTEMTSKLEASLTPGQAQGEPADCLGGVRHKGGVTLIQALVRNVGNCPDVKGEAQVEDPQG